MAGQASGVGGPAVALCYTAKLPSRRAGGGLREPVHVNHGAGSGSQVVVRQYPDRVGEGELVSAVAPDKRTAGHRIKPEVIPEG